MKFSKKKFKQDYLDNDKELDELYEPNDDFGGDKPELEVNSQVYTDTPKGFTDKSEYEEDIPTDTDKFKSNTKNTFKKLNGPYGSNMGSFYAGGGGVSESEDKMRDIIKELLKKRNDDRGIVDNGTTNDFNQNNVLDIDELDKPNIISTLNNFLGTINNDLSSDELGAIINHIFSYLDSLGLDLKNIPINIKNKIKNTL